MTSSPEAASFNDCAYLEIPRLPGQPWGNEECGRAVSAGRKALKNFVRRLTLENKTLFNQVSKETKSITKKSKEESWSSFLATINERTPITTVCKFF